MLSKILPWKLVLQRTARSYGFIDPIGFLARMRQFSQPSEVAEPIELLRAGVQFHARGLLNTRAIQTNLDWLWPYWVEKQFNARDPSFIPRAFSFSHVNLTHRNWTAVGLPDVAIYPLVDPRGLITPLYDGWSVDAWVLSDTDILLPSKLDEVHQTLELEPSLAVVTRAQKGELALTSRVEMKLNSQRVPQLHIEYRASGPASTRLIVAPRPYNPEGIQFIERVDFDDGINALRINGDTPLYFNDKPAKTHFSCYELGDVLHRLHMPSEGADDIHCHVGMSTAAAEFDHRDARDEVSVTVNVPLDADISGRGRHIPRHPVSWQRHIPSTARLQVPDDQYQFLYDAAVRTLSLLSADDIVPGPYTYFRFWFRDACLMMNALL